jgi:hypothetical protein
MLAEMRRRNGGIKVENKSERMMPTKKSRETRAVSLLNSAWLKKYALEIAPSAVTT